MKDIRQKGWFWLENNLIDREDLEAYEKLLYMALARYADSNGKCFPGLDLLMKVSGIGSRRTLTKYLRSLEEKGLIEIKKRTGKGNIYFLKNVGEKPGAKVHVGAEMTRGKNDTTPGAKVHVGAEMTRGKNDTTPGAKVHVDQVQICTPKETQLRKPNKDDDVNKNINTEEQENDTAKKSKSNNEHQTFVLDLAKSEMLKLCKNQMTVDTALITHRYKIQSLYRFLGKEKFLETFEKIRESSYLQEQARNAGQFFNWLFSSKKENFLSVFNDVYIDKNRSIAENETIPAYPELSEKDFDMDSMWED